MFVHLLGELVPHPQGDAPDDRRLRDDSRVDEVHGQTDVGWPRLGLVDAVGHQPAPSSDTNNKERTLLEFDSQSALWFIVILNLVAGCCGVRHICFKDDS